MALATGVVLAVGALTSSAAYTDFANLNVGGSGVGFAGRFDIAVVTSDGKVEQADRAGGFDWAVTDAAHLAPGHSVTTAIPVFNNTQLLAADTTFEIVLRNGDGTVAPGVPNITSFLRFTATDAAGTVLFTDVTWDHASGALGTLSARTAAPQAEGAVYAAGPAGSEQVVHLTISYPDAAGVENYNGGQSALAVRFHASSVSP